MAANQKVRMLFYLSDFEIPKFPLDPPIVDLVKKYPGTLPTSEGEFMRELTRLSTKKDHK